MNEHLYHFELNNALELNSIPFGCEIIIYLSGSDNSEGVFHREKFSDWETFLS
jgi:hypothetical protein